MNRISYILGFALLVVAATLAMTITVRNAPRASEQAANPAGGAGVERDGRSGNEAVGRSAEPVFESRDGARAMEKVMASSMRVSVADAWLAAMPEAEQGEWRERVAKVDAEAHRKLDQLTAALDLSQGQRAKLFPVLVRSAAGYDPAMLVGGKPSDVGSGSELTPSEAIHQALEPDQQTQVEDQEVERQLWWQDIISRLEADLVRSTGGDAGGAGDGTGEPVPATPATDPPQGERVAPGPREEGNLFDLLNGGN